MASTENKLLYLISIAAYIFALTHPLFTTSGEVFGFTFSSERITFFKSIQLLKQQNYVILSYALILFVICLPIIKYIVLLFNINGVNLFGKTIDSFLVQLQKYAMVDVFVIAILLIGSKSNPIFQFKIEMGTYALLASVILSILLSLSIHNNNKLIIGKL